MLKTATTCSEKCTSDRRDVIVIARDGESAGPRAAVRAVVGERMVTLDPEEALRWRSSGSGRLVVIAAPLDRPEVEAAAHAVSRDEGVVLWACVDHASFGVTQSLLRLGVSELFQVGADGAPAGLIDALRRHVGDGGAKTARLHAVLGLRGGVGASAVAAEYAFRSVRQLNGPRICLVDLDIGLGRAAERLGLVASWRPGAADASSAQPHWSGLRIASAPFLESFHPSEEAILSDLELFGRDADELVVDVSRSWPQLRDSVISRADVLTLVSDASATGLDIARRANLALDTLFPQAREVHVLINQRRLPRDRHLPDNRVAETMLGYDKVFVLDEDRDAFARAAGVREPVHYAAPASPFVRAFSAYADAVRSTKRATASAA